MTTVDITRDTTPGKVGKPFGDTDLSPTESVKKEGWEPVIMNL